MTKGNELVAIEKDLTEYRGRLKDALPPHIPVNRYIRCVVTALRKGPKLARAPRASFYSAVMDCAADGLMPDGREAALIPFGEKVQYLPMVAGILKKIRNSGELKSITAEVVHEKDVFKYKVTEKGPKLNYEPKLTGDRGKLTHCFVLSITKDGGVYVKIMSKEQIEKVRSVSRAKNAGPWKDWYDEMALKSCIKSAAKTLPMSTDIEVMLRRDDDMYDLDQTPSTTGEPEIKDAEATVKPSRTKKLVAEKVEEINGKLEEASQEEPEAAPVKAKAKAKANLFDKDEDGEKPF